MEIVWVRHAKSCENILHGIPKAHRVGMNDPHEDPPLTNMGVEQAKQARMARHPTSGKTLQHLIDSCDLICSSELIRAMETAAWLAPGRKVHILPFISEEAAQGGPNRGQAEVYADDDRKETLAYLNEHGLRGRVTWSIQEKIAGARTVDTEPNYSLFKGEVLPYLMSRGYKRVLIVSHGNYLYNRVFHGFGSKRPSYCGRCKLSESVARGLRMGNLSMFSIKYTKKTSGGYSVEPGEYHYEVTGFVENNACMGHDPKIRGHHVVKCRSAKLKNHFS